MAPDASDTPPMPPPPAAWVARRLDVTAMAVLLLLCAVWGLTQVSIKVSNRGISPLLQAGLRSAGSALLRWA